MTAPARITQLDIERAAKAVKAAGFERARIVMDKEYDLCLLGTPPEREGRRRSKAKALRGEQKPREAVVYFISTREVSPVKIGFTTDLRRRHAALQNHFPEPLLVLAKLSGGRTLERLIHERFAASRMKGEWFRRTPELMGLIREIRRGQCITDFDGGGIENQNAL